MRVKSAFIIFALLCSALLQAQTATDAFRYSQKQLSGSARYTAMAGAFGALGGDFSAVVDNPAGAAVFINSEIGLSAEFL
ncbi:MAG: transporter, partial [Flavobacteriaceae bacterium]